MTPAELTQARMALALSQRGLARVLGVSTGAVSLWEAGKRPVPPFLHLAMAWLANRPPDNHK